MSGGAVCPLGHGSEPPHLPGTIDPERVQPLGRLVDRCAGQRRVEQEISGEVALIDSGVDVEPHRRRLHERLRELAFPIGLDEMPQEPQRGQQPSRPLTLVAQDLRRCEIGLDDRTRQLRPRLGVARGGAGAPDREQPRGVTRPRRPAQRKHLIGEPAAIELIGTARGQRVEQRAADRRRILNQPSELRGRLRIDVRQRGVENLDFQTKPGPGPLEQLRERC